MSKCRKSPYLRQGKIDHQRLVSIAKNLSREVFYRTRDGMKLDVAVAITIDESGSMSNYYEVQLLAMAMGEALNTIGIPFEIIGTTTAYGGGDRQMPEMNGFTRVNPIVYNQYKIFNEQWANVRHRMVHTGCHHHNIDGEVVEYAAFRLKQRPERRKVIFSLSDGEPCAGHGNNEEMCVNLKRVCKRVRKEGVEVYGFGIQTESPRAFYGKEWFINLEEVNKMGPEFVREFTRIVTEGRVRV
jgi:cobalamin biosynthesis protein CobT